MSSFKIYGVPFHVDKKYVPIRPLGRGAYGVVCSAKDRETGEKVAIKRVAPFTQNSVLAKQALREIRLLRYLGRHPNIITLRDLDVREKEDELYIFMELMDTDLHRIIQSEQPLTDAHLKHFMYQLVRGVAFAHRNAVIHRDLKPSNLLVTKNCDLRITDFGLSRLAPEEGQDQAMTEHVVTRWYRPPELMLCADGNYTSAVDIWSVGCIFAELIGRKALFPGKHFIDQLTRIFRVIGIPPDEELRFIKSEQAMSFMRSLPHCKKVPFKTMFPYANVKAIDLLESMLVFDPAKRITAEQALKHPYFASVAGQYTDPEPVMPPEFEFEFEGRQLNKTDLRRLIVEEVRSFRREMVLSAAMRPQRPMSDSPVDSHDIDESKSHTSYGSNDKDAEVVRTASSRSASRSRSRSNSAASRASASSTGSQQRGTARRPTGGSGGGAASSSSRTGRSTTARPGSASASRPVAQAPAGQVASYGIASRGGSGRDVAAIGGSSAASAVAAAPAAAASQPGTIGAPRDGPVAAIGSLSSADEELPVGPDPAHRPSPASAAKAAQALFSPTLKAVRRKSSNSSEVAAAAAAAAAASTATAPAATAAAPPAYRSAPTTPSRMAPAIPRAAASPRTPSSRGNGVPRTPRATSPIQIGATPPRPYMPSGSAEQSSGKMSEEPQRKPSFSAATSSLVRAAAHAADAVMARVAGRRNSNSSTSSDTLPQQPAAAATSSYGQQPSNGGQSLSARVPSTAAVQSGPDAAAGHDKRVTVVKPFKFATQDRAQSAERGTRLTRTNGSSNSLLADAEAGATMGGTNVPATAAVTKKKPTTVPKSPAFQKMSWERSRDPVPPPQPAAVAAPPARTMVMQSASATKTRPTRVY